MHAADPPPSEPDVTLRGFVDHGHFLHIPILPLVFGVLATAAAAAALTRGMSIAMDEVGWVLLVVLGPLVALAGVLLYGAQSRRSDLRIHPDRITVHGSADDGRSIRHRDMQLLRLERGRIAVIETNGRRFAFRAARLHLEDAFDALTQWVEIENPECRVEDARRGAGRAAIPSHSAAMAPQECRPETASWRPGGTASWCSSRLATLWDPHTYRDPDLIRIARAELKHFVTEATSAEVLAAAAVAPVLHWCEVDPQAPISRAELCMLTFHPSGYTRETVLQRLAEHGPAAESLPFLLLRLNDWVPQVRDAAAAALGAHIAPRWSDDLRRHISLLTRLKNSSRTAHVDLLEQLQGIVADHADDALIHDLAELRGVAARAVLAFALDAGPDVATRALAAAEQHPEAVVRRIAIRALRRSHVAAALDSRARRWLTDRAGAVRREALYTLVEGGAEDLREVLRRLLADPNRGVRDAARFHFARGMDPEQAKDLIRAEYRALHDREGATVGVGAILGLGECGTTADLPRLRLVDPARIGARRAALRAMAKLDPAAAEPELWDALDSGHPGLVREAAQIFARHPWLVPTEILEELADPEAEFLLRRSALRMVAGQSGWDAVPVWCRLAADPDPSIAESARRFLGASGFWWSLQGGPEQRRAGLQRAQDRYAAGLGEELAAALARNLADCR